MKPGFLPGFFCVYFPIFTFNTSILLICGVYAKSFYQRKKKEHNYEKIFHHDIDNLNVRISRLYHNNRRRQYNPGQ